MLEALAIEGESFNFCFDLEADCSLIRESVAENLVEKRESELWP